MTGILHRVLAGFLGLIAVLIVFAWFVLLRPVAQPPTNDPLQIFNHGSIGNESSQGLPYWIWRVLPVLYSDYLPHNQDGFGSIGVYWVGGEELPVGFSKKTLGVIPRVAPNCAFCHQGTYRLHENDPATLAPAGAGTRVDVQGFIRLLMAVGQHKERFTGDNVMAAITAIYDMPLWERTLYRFLLIPTVRSALEGQATRFAWMDTRPAWGPGRIDPFNPVKFFNLHLPNDGTIGNSDIMPLWDLNTAIGDGSRQYSLHWDGLLSDLHETSVAGAIGDGMDYPGYRAARADLDVVMKFIRLQKPPSSPFSAAATDAYHVDAAEAANGHAIYQDKCSGCHDPGGARFRTVIPAPEVGTDRHRIDMWTREAADRYMAYHDGGYDWGFKAFHKTNGYVANELTGLWLRGPYLHNGSVPTLRDLLAPADKRPTQFYRGYDLIDTDGGGFVSQAGTPAQRYGTLYDTATPGNGNEGHRWGTDLPDDKKQQLLAYLKTL
jgi:hypothetical protein